MCATCLLKVCKQCHCDDQCQAVVGFCPYCRDISPVHALDIFKGTTEECALCRPPRPQREEVEEEEERPQHAMLVESSESESDSTAPNYFLPM